MWGLIIQQFILIKKQQSYYYRILTAHNHAKETQRKVHLAFYKKSILEHIKVFLTKKKN